MSGVTPLPSQLPPVTGPDGAGRPRVAAEAVPQIEDEGVGAGLAGGPRGGVVDQPQVLVPVD